MIIRLGKIDEKPPPPPPPPPPTHTHTHTHTHLYARGLSFRGAITSVVHSLASEAKLKQTAFDHKSRNNLVEKFITGHIC